MIEAIKQFAILCWAIGVVAPLIGWLWDMLQPRRLDAQERAMYLALLRQKGIDAPTRNQILQSRRVAQAQARKDRRQ